MYDFNFIIEGACADVVDTIKNRNMSARALQALARFYQAITPLRVPNPRVGKAKLLEAKKAPAVAAPEAKPKAAAKKAAPAPAVPERSSPKPLAAKATPKVLPFSGHANFLT